MTRLPSAQAIATMLALFALASTATSAQAASNCQVQITKPNGQLETLNVAKNSNKSYGSGKTTHNAYVMASGNNTNLEVVLGGSGTYISYYVESGKTLELPDQSKLKKIVCHAAQSNKSGTMKPSTGQIVSKMKADPSAAAKALKKLWNKDAQQIAKLLFDADVGEVSVLNGIKAAFGSGVTTIGKAIKGLIQAGADANSAIAAARQSFGNSVTGRRVAKWLREAGASNNQPQRKRTVEILKDQFNANREQVQTWLNQAGGWTNAQIQQALDAVYGASQLTAQQMAQAARQANKSAHQALADMNKALNVSRTEMMRWLRIAGYNTNQIAAAAVKEFGRGQQSLGDFLRAMKQAGVDVGQAVQAAYTAFGNSITGKAMAKLVADAGYISKNECEKLTRFLKDRYKANRDTAEQWLKATNRFAASIIQAALDAVYGATKAAGDATANAAVNVSYIWEGSGGVSPLKYYSTSNTPIRVWKNPRTNNWSIRGANVHAINNITGLPTNNVVFIDRINVQGEQALRIRFDVTNNRRGGQVQFRVGNSVAHRMNWAMFEDRDAFVNKTRAPNTPPRGGSSARSGGSRPDLVPHDPGNRFYRTTGATTMANDNKTYWTLSDKNWCNNMAQPPMPRNGQLGMANRKTIHLPPLNVGVENKGTATSTTFQVRIASQAWNVTGGIGAGQTINGTIARSQTQVCVAKLGHEPNACFACTTSPSQNKPYSDPQFQLIVDSTNRVDESNENNNRAYLNKQQ